MPPSKPAAEKKPAAKPAARRDDLNTAIGPWFEKLPPAHQANATALRALLDAVVPDATTGLKWGNPFWTLNGEIVCGIRAAKAHLGLILPGTGADLPDPKGLLEGDSKTGRHLKIAAGAPLPAEDIRGWVELAAARVRG
jgi:hypothetical protein